MPWQPSSSSRQPLTILPILPYPPQPEKEDKSREEMNMSSLYLRGSTWWAKSREAAKVVRWSLGTRSASGKKVSKAAWR